MTKAPSRRSIRIADLLMRELASLLSSEVQNPRLNTLTISGVRLNADLSVATVLFTVPQDTEATEIIQKELQKATGFLRHNLAKRLELKFIPKLQFKHDDFLEKIIYG